MRGPTSFLSIFVIGLFLLGVCTATAQTSGGLSQKSGPPSESELSRNEALAPGWANRVTAKDSKTRATAEAALVEEAGHSLPLLRRYISTRNEELHVETFEVLRRMGP